MDPIEGVGDEEAMVFRVDEREDGEYVISVEENESRAITIFEYYYDLLEKDAGKRREGDMGLKKEDKMDKGGILDELFDRAEKEIVLADEKGRELSFKAVFATVDNDAVYCILAPLEEVRGLSRNDALVFAVSRGQMFTPVKDKALCRKIFSEYYRFVREGGK